MEQPMHFIYRQINQKGLYFYILSKGKHFMLGPKHIIGKVYDQYKDNNNVLYVVYSDRNLTESKVINFIFYVAQVVLVLYLVLYAYNYFAGGSQKEAASHQTGNSTESPPDKPDDDAIPASIPE